MLGDSTVLGCYNAWIVGFTCVGRRPKLMSDSRVGSTLIFRSGTHSVTARERLFGRWGSVWVPGGKVHR